MAQLRHFVCILIAALCVRSDASQKASQTAPCSSCLPLNLREADWCCCVRRLLLQMCTCC